jgi:hypothetical protein
MQHPALLSALIKIISCSEQLQMILSFSKLSLLTCQFNIQNNEYLLVVGILVRLGEYC